MLKIKKLSAASETQPLLKNINLEIKSGEIHAVMGPKHSGKSALAHVITGHPSIQITEGDIFWNRKNLANMEIDDRISQGIFISFQFPPEYDIFTNWELTKAMFISRNADFDDLAIKYNTCSELLDLGTDHGDRFSNSSGMTMSQAKRNELIYMFLSNPKLIVLDEIDEGMSEEHLNLIAILLKDYLREKNKGCLVITHNQTLLKILEPTHVHVMVSGEIKMSGNEELYTRIVEDGYSEFS
jgi:Fe-S cluster assembly ATP-binding protein